MIDQEMRAAMWALFAHAVLSASIADDVPDVIGAAADAADAMLLEWRSRFDYTIPPPVTTSKGTNA